MKKEWSRRFSVLRANTLPRIQWRPEPSKRICEGCGDRVPLREIVAGRCARCRGNYLIAGGEQR